MTIRDLLEKLAAHEPTATPVLSIYLDRRPQETGQNPGMRESDVILKDRLHYIEKTLLPRGASLDSLRADRDRIEAYLNGIADPAAQGIAIFACSSDNLFETVEVGTPFDNQVSFASRPDLFQLARMLDEQEVAVVAVVDSNTARLFVWRAGWFDEVGGPDDKNTKMYRKRQMGGWSQKRFQRRIDNNRDRFAAESAAAIEDLVNSERATRLILAGDEVAITPLKDHLSPHLLAMIEDVLRVHIRAPQEDIKEEIAPILAEAEADDSRGVTDRLIESIKSDGLALTGLPAVRAALERGQVDTLLLDPQAEIDAETRSDLVRLATTTAADVVVVDDHTAFRELGGVGGILRYRTWPH